MYYQTAENKRNDKAQRKEFILLSLRMLHSAKRPFLGDPGSEEQVEKWRGGGIVRWPRANLEQWILLGITEAEVTGEKIILRQHTWVF